MLPTIDTSTGDWLIGGTDSGVKAQAPSVTVDSITGHLMINGEDSGVNVVGPQGIQGVQGDSAVTIKVGSVTTGDSPTVTNSGTATDLTLDFVLPKSVNGKDGATPTFSIGTVTTGSTAAVQDQVSGTTHTLNFTLPKQDMSAYTNTADLTKLLAGKLDKSGLTAYYTAAQLDTKLSAKADLAMVANIADKDTVNTLSQKLSKLSDQVNMQDQTISALNDKVNALLAKSTKPLSS
ncbi:hypothetical protein EFM36_08660 [Limosilactobacillus fermentum]|nr:hypothetical protein [Limosilactobacillus fermentum]